MKFVFKKDSLTMQPTIILKQITADDAGTLLVLAKRIFYNSFAHLNSAESMDIFAARAFTIQQLTAEGCFPLTYSQCVADCLSFIHPHWTTFGRIGMNNRVQATPAYVWRCGLQHPDAEPHLGHTDPYEISQLRPGALSRGTQSKLL
ncbi:MAG: hypothetical protein EOO38_29600 [Cytophagaceae bacterium]|nr:MAG: hypothetical protein EOO38_29600 [Cytophagaceae bacterium]